MTGDLAECDGKKQFATYYQAQRAAQRLNRREHRARGNPYKCIGSKHFHIGNTLGKKRKDIPSRHTRKEIAEYGRKKFPI